MNKILKNELYETPVFENIREVIAYPVKNYPENIAFKIKEKEGKKVSYKEITYKELQNQINALGTAFINLGLKDKRIAIISKNKYEWVLTYLATMNGTGITVPLDKGLPEEEIESLLQRSYADCIVFAEEYLEIIKKIEDKKSTKLTKFICMDKFDKEKYPNFMYIQDLLKTGEKLLKDGNKEFLNAEIDNKKMASIIFTSGTTAASKAVMLSHKNIAANITAMRKAEKIYSTDVNMAFLPLHHTFGSTGILMFLNHGCTNVFCDGIRHIQENLKEYKVTIFVCVPLLLEAMYKKRIMTYIRKNKKTRKRKTNKNSNSNKQFSTKIWNRYKKKTI